MTTTPSTHRSTATDQCEYGDDCVADWTYVLEVQLPDGPETFRACTTCASRNADRSYVRIRRRRS